MTDLNLKVQQDMIKDGWRQCAKGQRTTQYCGLMENALTEKQAEIDKLRAALKAAADGFDKVAAEIKAWGSNVHKYLQDGNDLSAEARKYKGKAAELRELLTDDKETKNDGN